MLGFEEFADFLDNSARTCHARLQAGLHEVGRLAQPLAAQYIGHELPQWAPLSEATMQGFVHPYGFYIPGKVELGYVGHVSASDPLLRTGAMRDSIATDVDGLTLVLGSPSKVALFQEMGTHNPLTGDIPPRPFLALAMQNSLPHATLTFGEIAVALLNPTARLGGGRRP